MKMVERKNADALNGVLVESSNYDWGGSEYVVVNVQYSRSLDRNTAAKHKY